MAIAIRLASVVILISVLVSSSWAAEAAAAAGSLEIGGSIAFERRDGEFYEDAEANAETRIEIMPRVAYFVARGLSLGIVFEYAKQGFDAGDDETQFGIGPSVAYYLGSGERAILPFAHAAILYQKYTSIGDITGRSLHLEGGIVAMVGAKLGVKLAVFYKNDSFDVEIIPDDPFEDIRKESVSGGRLGFTAGLTGFLF